jgi:hypothetical protein
MTNRAIITAPVTTAPGPQTPMRITTRTRTEATTTPTPMGARTTIMETVARATTRRVPRSELIWPQENRAGLCG